MARPSISWKQAIVRQYSMDGDLRGAVHGGVVGAFGGFIGSFLWPSFVSRSFLALFGIFLLSSIFVARKRSMNPAILLQATLLGFVFGSSIMHVFLSTTTSHTLFSLYVMMMATFHYTEFLFTAITNRRGLQADSFLLNHSIPYWIAAFSSWTEFTVESYFFPFIKTEWIGFVGFFLCIVGEFIRKTAMLHAGNGFTHKLAMTKRIDHRLCTSGIYSLVRHPGYLGWFMWSVGTQLILCNPFCIIAYTIVTWRFFDERIRDEERDLITFFGKPYIEYQEKVWIGVPFVEGYTISD